MLWLYLFGIVFTYIDEEGPFTLKVGLLIPWHICVRKLSKHEKQRKTVNSILPWSLLQFLFEFLPYL